MFALQFLIGISPKAKGMRRREINLDVTRIAIKRQEIERLCAQYEARKTSAKVDEPPLKC